MHVDVHQNAHADACRNITDSLLQLVCVSLSYKHTYTHTYRAGQPGNTQSGAVKRGPLLQKGKNEFPVITFGTANASYCTHTVN